MKIAGPIRAPEKMTSGKLGYTPCIVVSASAMHTIGALHRNRLGSIREPPSVLTCDAHLSPNFRRADGGSHPHYLWENRALWCSRTQFVSMFS